MTDKNEKDKKESKYLWATGRRKTAVAQVRIYSEKLTKKSVQVNEKDYQSYFPLSVLQGIVLSPLELTGNLTKLRVTVKVDGGGIRSQAEAVRLGISRALLKVDEKLRKTLKDKNYLTRDPREKERKKPGLKKARRAPQWTKR
jgi:small subunit ribosomal protein S9